MSQASRVLCRCGCLTITTSGTEEGERLDLAAVGVPKPPVQVHTAGVRGEFAVEAGAQPLEGMSMMPPNRELLGPLVVDRLDHLAPAMPPPCDAVWEWRLK